MRTVQVSEAAKALIERHVAKGAATDEAAFVEAAVRRYAEEIQDEEDALIAAAEEGIAAIERGDYTTISGPDDLAAFNEHIWARAMRLAKDMRATDAARVDEVGTKAGE